MDRCGQPKGTGGCREAAFVGFTRVLLIGRFRPFRVPQLLVYQPRRGQRIGTEILHGGSPNKIFVLVDISFKDHIVTLQHLLISLGIL